MYLTYSTSCGLSKPVEDLMNEKINEMKYNVDSIRYTHKSHIQPMPYCHMPEYLYVQGLS